MACYSDFKLCAAMLPMALTLVLFYTLLPKQPFPSRQTNVQHLRHSEAQTYALHPAWNRPA